MMTGPVGLVKAVNEKWVNLSDGFARARRRDGSAAALRFTARWLVAGSLRPVHFIRHRMYDHRLGIETTGRTGVTSAMRSAAMHADGTRYEPMAPHQFRVILRRLPVVYPERFTFIDLGSGKGLPLLLAADHGFGAVVGVELNPELLELSRSNVRSFEARIPERSGVIAVLHGDAAKFVLPPHPTVLFMFNPFGEATLRVVADNIERSLKDVPRSFFLAYCNPLHREVLDERPMLHRIAASAEWACYEARVPGAEDNGQVANSR